MAAPAAVGDDEPDITVAAARLSRTLEARRSGAVLAVSMGGAHTAV